MTEVQIASRIPLDDYAAVIGTGEIDELRALAKPLLGRSVEMVNSTAVGGGVAEILNRLIPLAEELGIAHPLGSHDRRRRLLRGHQGVSQRAARRALPRRPRDFDVFRAYNERIFAAFRSTPNSSSFTIRNPPA